MKWILIIALNLVCGLAFAIEGGKPVKLSLSPRDAIERSVVSLKVETEADINACTGVVIAPDRILTAAHCFADDPEGPVNKDELYDIAEQMKVFYLVDQSWPAIKDD